MKHIGYIDPFIENPSFHCFNGFVSNFNLSSFYHMPAKVGLRSLYSLSGETKAYFVAGSASNVTEPLDWHRPLAEFLVDELQKGKPVLAACFGHQLLCHFFGSEVGYVLPEKSKILGVREIPIKKSGFGFASGESFCLPVSHRQVVKALGPDLIALGENFPNDIVAHKTLPLLSTQAHPEASKHFCAYDIEKLTEEEDLRGRGDGKRFIEKFLLHFKLLSELQVI